MNRPLGRIFIARPLSLDLALQDARCEFSTTYQGRKHQTSTEETKCPSPIRNGATSSQNLTARMLSSKILKSIRLRPPHGSTRRKITTSTTRAEGVYMGEQSPNFCVQYPWLFLRRSREPEVRPVIDHQAGYASQSRTNRFHLFPGKDPQSRCHCGVRRMDAVGSQIVCR